jgi:SSS family transporter
MHTIDWIVVAAYLVWIVQDGLKRTQDANKVEGYFLANRSLPWWAVGLSVMATQLSAITLVGTTGLGYADGMRFVQFYFGLPVAMVILSVTLVPFFYRARVYTAYEYLERRFDLKTRTLATILFLFSRGMSCGVIIAAPAVILSIILGWNLTLTILAIGVPTVIYTMLGGVQAVTWTDVKQMVVILVAVGATVVTLIIGLPHDVGVGTALKLAGAAGRLNAVDFHFDPHQTYTFWSGLLGGLFLMLSYIGCDQSQVQRYLTAKSVDEGRNSLLMSAYFKIPLQALILLTGVLVFVFYLFHQPPMLFNRVHAEQIEHSPRAAEYRQLESEFQGAFAAQRHASAALAASAGTDQQQARQQFQAASKQMRGIRQQAAKLVREVTGDNDYSDLTGDTPTPDVNYVFPTFVTTTLPVGLVGLMIAAIFAAAMSSIAAELNSLATATVMDIYRRLLRPEAPDAEYLRVSRLATAVWGAFACLVATFAAGLGSLIEVVNRFGSFFYGSILGVFVLALAFRRSNGHGAFFGLIGGMAVVAFMAFDPATKNISFLWQNPVGVAAVLLFGLTVSAATGGPSPRAPEASSGGSHQSTVARP